VLVAPPGTGKTTVVPPALIEEPWLAGGRIVVLEPRRLAARAAASRMAALHGEEVGHRFGYRVRHDRRVSRSTRVEVVTEGVLTRRLQADPALEGVGMVVLDELHERSLDADLALALLLDVQAGLRPELRILAMSATLDAGSLAEVMDCGDGPAPVLSAEAPLHPVALRWRPANRRHHLEEGVAEVVEEAWRTDSGDVLVFLPGRAEIARTARRLRARLGEGTVAELHGSVPPAEQDRVLSRPAGSGRRVVLSTSIAESSLTVPGVRVVVDAGRRRSTTVNPRTGLPSLSTSPVSRAGADQRSGRAGREGPGVCYRLWAETDHRHRDPFDEPEITRADLGGLVLALAVWGVGDLDELRWLDSPPAHAVQRARRLLRDLDALDAEGRPTELGRALAGMPMAPRLAAMVKRAGTDDDLALELAALIEAGGPGSADLSERVRARREGREHPEVDRVLKQFRWDNRTRSGRGSKDRGSEDRGSKADSTEVLADDLDRRIAELTLAGFAERVARRRDSDRPRSGGRHDAVYQLRHGGEVAVEAGSPLAGHEWLVVVDLDAGDGRERTGKVRLAGALDRPVARELVRSHGVEERRLHWEPGTGAVGSIVTRLDEITVESRPWHDPGADEVNASLIESLELHGPAMLPRWADSAALRARVAFAAAVGLRCPSGEWPRWSNPESWSSWDSMREWLEPALSGVTTQKDLDRLDVGAVLGGSLDHADRQFLRSEVPTEWTAPNGRRIPLRYGVIDAAVDSVLMSVRLQHLLGVDVQPTVSSQHVVVAVELLSPADRPVQRTTDLPGFWRGSYRQVRAEMRSRYRRHDWPENPV
jgi:ATP-dependent helicase HrpB